MVTLTFADYNQRQFLTEDVEDIVEKVMDKNLKHVLSYGIGMIYEGIDPSDRQIVEDLF